MNGTQVKRGDVHLANLDPVVGSEQSGNERPVLIIQNDIGNEHSPTTIIAPLSSNLRKKPLPTHVLIPSSVGLDKDSIVLIEQIRVLDRSRLSNYIGSINDKIQADIDKALAICVGIEHRRSPKGEMLILTLCHRCESDFRNSGYFVIKRGWQEHLETCDFCKGRMGLTFGIFNMDGGE